MLKKIDLYIIRKFIGTYFSALLLIVCIFIIFDISEKIDDFVTKKAPLKQIIFNYYLTFIPFFLNTFSSLFVFITVIFFTSKMAYNTEIIAILSSGVSFIRILYPYFISATLIFLFSAALNHIVIPPANKIRLEFEAKYIKSPYQRKSLNLHLQIEPNLYLYLTNFQSSTNRATYFSLERFENGILKSKLMADYAVYNNKTNVWQLNNYFIRHLSDSSEIIEKGLKKDTVINFSAEELKQRDNIVTSMNYFELQDNIREQKMRGQNPSKALLENFNRTSMPFSVFVLTLIGVSLSSRKVRGGIGLQIGIGIAMSFSYILLLRFSEIFIQVGIANPLMAAWIPNILFTIIAIAFYVNTPK
ncbi:MAG: LptF/LptG family permease [Prevotellaceae bacterium]|nr:LptF/LptG family permease [Prevotellaceae bacterium]